MLVMPEHDAPTQLIKNVAFFGYSDTDPGDPLYDLVYEAAQYMAEKGYAIVNGGGPGVMAAATKGAEVANGETITVTFDPQNAPGFEGRYVGNVPDKEIKTHNYVERMFKLMEVADFYVVFNGGTGTLSEFATAWVLARLYKGHHKAFVLFGDFWRPVVAAIEENMLIRQSEKTNEIFQIVTTKEGIYEAIQQFEQQMGQLDHTHCHVCGEHAFMT